MSFNQEFCSILEYRLSESLASSKNNVFRFFWCDGVLHEPYSPAHLSNEWIEINGIIVTKARLGQTGQDEYEMTIVFGDAAKTAFLSGLSLIQYIPVDEPELWISIDTVAKKVQVKLY